MNNINKDTKIESEQLAYWYFRLNGFLTIQNFVIHPEKGREQRTDIDILGVRFPYRAELLENSMPDDAIFAKVKSTSKRRLKPATPENFLSNLFGLGTTVWDWIKLHQYSDEKYYFRY